MIEYCRKRLLGKGATAEVFLVEEIGTKREYAMKVCKDKELAETEAFLLQKVHNAMFPKFEEYFEEQGYCLVMEYIEGNSLQEILDRGNFLEIEEILYIMDALLTGLQDLHLSHPGVVYRDLKPANIMLDMEGRVRLIDLGAACIEGEGAEKISVKKAGTYGYAAPEQFWEGVKPNKACDIYGAGKILAYLLSGKNPVEPPYDMRHYCEGLKGKKAAFIEVVNRSLSMEPQARYEDCESMRRAIHRAYDISLHKKWFQITKNSPRIYKKCIWKSEYRRIF